MGGQFDGGVWKNIGHLEPQEDVRNLMRDGDAGWKIPFHTVKHFRGFLARRKKGK